ncbi:hypothetical protein RF11_12469 [Thelohanellus kitauei]|uniref:Tc1-like transposase DDE domain-containing protein n=1 Tax=Thelohanellus kitauei TaxID=669202 RepID=A0A0C2N9P3_THEKT|nr:hypothetical protein RF11_12469 [Thelohanellus kitauei]
MRFDEKKLFKGGWLKSERINKKNIKSNNITVCSAISRNSTMYYNVSERAFNNDIYMDFLTNLMSITIEKQLKNVIFIMDNTLFHKEVSIKSFKNSLRQRIVSLIQPRTCSLSKKYS